MSDDDMMTEAEALAAIVTPPTLVHYGPMGREYLAPPGWQRHTIPRDDFRTEAFDAGDVKTFVKWAAERADEGSLLMHNPVTQRIAVVVDYQSDDPLKGRRLHTIELSMQPDRDWQAWEKIDRRFIRKEDLLEHLLEHGHNVVSPPAAEMYELVRDLKAIKKVQFRDVRDVSSGSFEVQWSDETKATAGTFKVPREITVRCSPWEETDPVYVHFEFRYTLGDSGLLLTLVALPLRMPKLKQQAFEKIAGEIASTLDMFPYRNAMLT